MKFILTILFGLMSIAVVIDAAITCNPDLTREVIADPADCTRYHVCAFGRASEFTCTATLPNFDACTLKCGTSTINCLICNSEATTTGSTTTVNGDVTTTPGESTTINGETTSPGETTTTELNTESTTLEIPTPTVINPTPPTTNPPVDT